MTQGQKMEIPDTLAAEKRYRGLGKSPSIPKQVNRV